MKIETIEDVAGLPCLECGGSGKVGCRCVFDSQAPHDEDKCPNCNGTGLAFPMLSEKCHNARNDKGKWCQENPDCALGCYGTGRLLNATLERCLEAAEGIGVWRLIQTMPKGYGMVIMPHPMGVWKDVGKFGDTPLEAVQAVLIAAAKERYESTQH